MALETKAFDEAVSAARDGAIAVDRSDLGMLKFSGETRLDLIHRMSTQAVKDLAPGAGAATVLTTDIGRSIDRLILYATGDTVYALTGEDNADNVARYLLRFVFFQDDFHVEDLTAQTFIFGVYGAGARERLRALFGDTVDLPLHHWQQLELDGATTYLHRTDPVAGDGYFVMGDEADKERVWAALVESGVVPAGPEAFEYLRLASGRPRFGREISADYIPLETGLWDDVSFNKGCYTGQEVIARMESRGRLAKKLVHLRAEGPVEPGSEIEVDGRSAGTVTSAASGPDGVFVLGYVKTRALEAVEEAGEGELLADGVRLHLLAPVGGR
ncbi:MAG: glycine cleavage system protein T [Anaerolineae bacterium]|nr:glycine cleavage system protein T [Anaerolineae bacterium]